MKKFAYILIINIVAYFVFRHIYAIVLFLTGIVDFNTSSYTVVEDIPRLIIHLFVLGLIVWKNRTESGFVMYSTVTALIIIGVYLLDINGYLYSLLII